MISTTVATGHDYGLIVDDLESTTLTLLTRLQIGLRQP